MNRYEKAQKKAKSFETWTANQRIRSAVLSGFISGETRILKDGERLDHIAGELWGDSQAAWVIAACSGIGWWLQCPPGTLLFVPDSLDAVKEYAR
jgi:hypothetical protein